MTDGRYRHPGHPGDIDDGRHTAMMKQNVLRVNPFRAGGPAQTRSLWHVSTYRRSLSAWMA
jgi:hypothetical protein